MSIFRFTLLVAVSVVTALSPARLHATTGPEYGMIDLGTLGGAASQALGINDAGQVVGGAYTAGGVEHAFLYSGGKMKDLGVVTGGDTSEAEAINASGQVAGWSTNGEGDPYGNAEQVTFVYSGGKMSSLGALAGDYNSYALGINDQGQVVGESYSYGAAVEASGATYSDENAFLYTNGTMKDLGPLADGFYSEATGINDAGQVAGWSDTGSYDNGYLEYSAVRYAADGVAQNLGVPLGETNSFGQAINASGSVVGYTYSTGTAYLALLFSSNGGIKLLGTLPNGSSSLALGINKSGQIVGEADVGTVDANDNPIYHAFLYTGGAMYDLNSLCKNSTGYRIEYGAGINDSGEIVGYMLAPSGQIHAMLLVPLLTSPPIITTQPASKNAGAGGSVTFTVAALSGTTFHYQWEKNGVAISGATSTKLTLTKVVPSNDGNYTVVVTNKVGSVTSSKAALTVIGTGASIATEPKSVLKAKAGATVTFKVVAKGTAPFSYQWQFNGGNLKNAENYTGATTATLTIKKVNAGNAGNYQVLVWNVVNASKPAKSTVVQLTIK